MKHCMGITKNKYEIKENTFILYIFILTMISLILVKNGSKQALIMHSVYAIILMAMGITVLNIMRFNIDRLSKYLGVIYGLTGLLEISYIAIRLNFEYNVIIITKLGLILSITADVLPILALYLGLKFRYRKSSLNQDTVKIVIIIFLYVVGLLILLNNIKLENLSKVSIYNRLYFLEVINSILIVSMSFAVVRKLKSDDTFDSTEQIHILKRIAVLIGLSRISTILHFVIGNIYIEDIIGQFITNIAMYYSYKYIVFSNIKKPYLKLNDTNMFLKEKAEKLKYNNKKLLIETDVIQNLKQELTIKEMKLQSTLNYSPNSIAVFNKNKEITFVNKNFEQNFIRKENDENINDCLKLKIANYDDIIYNIDHIVKELCNKEDYIYTVDSKVYLARYTPLIIKQKLEGVLCILIDKTNIKSFQDKLISANERYDSFLERIDDGIVVFEDGKKIYSNNACKNIFGDCLEEMDFILEDKDEVKVIIDGKEKYVTTKVSSYDKNGKNKKIIVIKDITERKLSQMKLQKHQSSYERFIDILPDGICILDRDLNIYYANKSLLDMIEIQELDEIKNKNIKEIMILNEERKNEINIVLKKVLEKSKQALLVDWEVITKSNCKVQVEVSALPFNINNEKHIIFILKDLTNQKTSEIAEKELLNRLSTDKVKTEFFADMSHELKTPLNVISSSNQLLDAYYKSGKINDYNSNIKYHIDLVRQNSYRLQRLINNIIDITKMDSGYYKLNLEEHNIVMVIEDLFMRVGKYAKKKNINLIFDTDMEEINMLMDKSQIERIMLNLLSNCIKFTDNNGTIYVYIYFRFEEVVIKVKDTGIGIPNDKLELIFEEFAQADKTLSRNTEGSGIGLAIVKNLVELHGGNIKVRSIVNKGTEFIISLPIKNIKGKNIEKDKSIYNIEEKINIEFSDIYY